MDWVFIVLSISLILVSLDVYFTWRTMAAYFKIAYEDHLKNGWSPEIARRLARNEADNLENNQFVRAMFKSINGKWRFLVAAAWASLFYSFSIVVLYSLAGTEATLVTFGVMIGFQIMTVETHLKNIEDLKTWKFGKSH